MAVPWMVQNAPHNSDHVPRQHGRSSRWRSTPAYGSRSSSSPPRNRSCGPSPRMSFSTRWRALRVPCVLTRRDT